MVFVYFSSVFLMCQLLSKFLVELILSTTVPPAKRELTKTLFIVTVVSLLLWLPYTIFSVLLFYLHSRLPPYPVSYLFNAFIVLFHANSLVNPILYAVRMPDFKRALVSLFRRQQRKVEIIPLGPL